MQTLVIVILYVFLLAYTSLRLLGHAAYPSREWKPSGVVPYFLRVQRFPFDQSSSFLDYFQRDPCKTQNSTGQNPKKVPTCSCMENKNMQGLKNLPTLFGRSIANLLLVVTSSLERKC